MLLEEVKITKFEILNEGKKNGNLKVRGIFQRADEANNNKRVYPRKILDNQIERLRPMFESRQLVGELDHPAEAVVSLKNASHLITNLYWNGNDVVGEAEILPTPAGQIAEALIRSGVRIGVSSRGVGSLTEGVDGKVVNEDYVMLTFDLVADPSTKGAYPSIAESRTIAQNFANNVIKKTLGEKVFLTLLEGKLNEMNSDRDEKHKATIKSLEKFNSEQPKDSSEEGLSADVGEYKKLYKEKVKNKSNRPKESEVNPEKHKEKLLRRSKVRVNKKWKNTFNKSLTHQEKEAKGEKFHVGGRIGKRTQEEQPATKEQIHGAGAKRTAALRSAQPEWKAGRKKTKVDKYIEKKHPGKVKKALKPFPHPAANYDHAEDVANREEKSHTDFMMNVRDKEVKGKGSKN